VRDQDTGYLVDPGSPASLAAAMSRFIDFPLDILAFGDRARRVVSDNSLTRQVRRLVDIYEAPL
jgi:glycosyltransferase involved in cell wall biosynthesis